jgi:uncharacterized protein YegL
MFTNPSEMKIMKKTILVLVSLSALLLMGCPPPTPAISAKEKASIAVLQSGVAVAVVLDTSGSMRGAKLKAVKSILQSSIKDKLSFYAVMGAGKLHLSLIECGGGPHTRLPMAEYKEGSFLTTVKNLGAGGGTPLGASVNSAYAELAKSGCKDKHIFILSDGQAGDDVSSVLNSHSKDISIYVIGFQTDQSNYRDFAKVGGQVIMADDAKTLDDTTNNIFKAILKLEAE